MGFYSQSFRFEGLAGEIKKRNRYRIIWKIGRLRWVNYLHPGLKRGKMSPHEERLVLELHGKWGNRWSRIAKKIPGRTDNEIKNYWRTHMRKTAQEKKRASSSPSSTQSSSNSNSNSNSHSSSLTTESFYDNGGSGMSSKKDGTDFEDENGYSMDDIWKEIEGSVEFSCYSMASTSWDYCWDSLWKMDDVESLTG